jgi:hypothetical protein
MLYLAYRLQLEPLQEVLHGFTRACVCSSKGVLRGGMRSVLTERVKEAAAEEGLVEEGLLQLLVAQRCSLTGFRDGLFEPVEAGFIAPPVLLKARLKRALPGLTPGQVVDVALNHHGSTLKVAGTNYESQLLVGPPVHTSSSKEAVLGKAADGAPTT